MANAVLMEIMVPEGSLQIFNLANNESTHGKAKQFRTWFVFLRAIFRTLMSQSLNTTTDLNVFTGHFDFYLKILFD